MAAQRTTAPLHCFLFLWPSPKFSIGDANVCARRWCISIWRGNSTACKCALCLSLNSVGVLDSNLKCSSLHSVGCTDVWCRSQCRKRQQMLVLPGFYTYSRTALDVHMAASGVKSNGQILTARKEFPVACLILRHLRMHLTSD